MSTETDWQQRPLGELVDHILTQHHAYTYRTLSLISEMLTWNMRNHWMKHPELLQAHIAFHRVKAALEQHMIQEETAGFRLIKAHEKNPGVSLAPFLNTIDQHEEAHADAASGMAEVKTILWNGSAPADLGREVATTLEQIDALLTDLIEHIHLENDILFPRARALAS